MINLKIDFRDDYYNFVRYEIQKLKNFGFSFPNIGNSESYELAEYLNLLERIPNATPRKIFRTANFLCPNEYVQGLKFLEDKILSGQSLLGHLSTKILKADYSDGMQYDFGITHLHLGIQKCENNPKFVKRTACILYCILTDDSAYFITIDKHGRWADEKLLYLVKDNFPELLGKYEIKGVTSINPAFTEAERIKIRKSHVYSLIQIDKKVYLPFGCGVVSNGFSKFAMTKFIHQMKFIEFIENELRTIFEHNENSIKRDIGNLKSMELHFFNFTKPLLIAGNKLDYKIILDWDIKNISPVTMKIENMKNEYIAGRCIMQ